MSAIRKEESWVGKLSSNSTLFTVIQILIDISISVVRLDSITLGVWD